MQGVMSKVYHNSHLFFLYHARERKLELMPPPQPQPPRPERQWW
jgi:hypothetical protein